MEEVYIREEHFDLGKDISFIPTFRYVNKHFVSLFSERVRLVPANAHCKVSNQ